MEVPMGFIKHLLLVSVATIPFHLSAAPAGSCNFGLFAKCFSTTATPKTPSSKWRFESYGGYKSGMKYFNKEQEQCKNGCDFDATGPVYGIDSYYNLSGNNRTDDYMDVGIQYLSIPVGQWKSDIPFAGTNETTIDSGNGSLRYHFVRATVKRGSFLYIIKSKYLISSFGFGLAIPEAQGTGRDFVGAGDVHPTIGGKLGVQLPLAENIDLGIASGWSVLWYGSRYSDSAFISGYGINLSIRV